MNSKLRNFLLMFGLFISFNPNLVYSQEWMQTIKALETTPQDENKILANWSNKVQKMSAQELEEQLNGLNKHINGFQNIIDKAKTDQEFRKKLLELNPKNIDNLKAKLQKALMVKAAFDILP